MVVVPRSRFAPVKNINDLLVIRSDAFVMSEDSQLGLAPERNGNPPIVNLDESHYKFVEQLDHAISRSMPSLIKCERLHIRGPVRLEGITAFSGCVEIINPGSREALLPAGLYEDETVFL